MHKVAGSAFLNVHVHVRHTVDVDDLEALVDVGDLEDLGTGSFTVDVGVRGTIDIVVVIGVRVVGVGRRLATAEVKVGTLFRLAEGVYIPNNLGICVIDWPKPP